MFWKTKKKVIDSETGNQMELQHNERTGALKLRTDGQMATGKDSLLMLEQMSEISGFPTFKGKIEHAYESDFLGYKDKCPNCGAATVQMFSNFPYATETRPRIMTAPAGWFCPDCPTVIIDDDVMQDNIDDDLLYYGVFSIETGYSEETELFITLNGKKSIYVLSDMEEQEVGGIVHSVHQPGDGDYMPYSTGGANYTPPKPVNKAKKKKKKKAAKKARKRHKK